MRAPRMAASAFGMAVVLLVGSIDPLASAARTPGPKTRIESIPATLGPVVRAKTGDRCSRALSGTVRLDPETGLSMICSSGSDGLRWRAATGNDRSIEFAQPFPAAPITPPVGPGDQREGQRCARPAGSRTLSVATGLVIVCTPGPDGRRWVAEKAVDQRNLPTTTVPLPTVASVTYTDPLDPNLGNPTGLPPGVSLPPGAVVLAGMPQRSPAIDYWKKYRWFTGAIVPGTDPAVVHQWFVTQCANIGWLHDVRADEDLPGKTPPPPFYDGKSPVTDQFGNVLNVAIPPTRMVIGECRTKAGNPNDPTRRRPWYLAWSVIVRPNSTTMELVVELRDTSVMGGLA